MSMHVYDAFTYAGTLPELVAYLRCLRRRESARAAAQIAGRLSGHRGRVAYGDLEQCLERGIASSAPNFTIRTTAGAVYVANPRSSAVVYPTAQRLLVQFFGMRHGFGPRKFKLPATFQDFHYQNQADRPDEVSATEWKARAQVWDRIFATVDTPTEAGLSYPIVEPEAAWRLASAVYQQLRDEHKRPWRPYKGAKPKPEKKAPRKESKSP